MAAKVNVYEIVRGSTNKRVESFNLETEQEVEKFVERFNKVNVPTDGAIKRSGRYLYAASARSGGIY